MNRMRCRKGATMVEMCLCLVLGVMILTLGFALVTLSHRAEDMGGLRSDATAQVALAHASLDADLGALVDDAQQYPITIAEGPSSPWGRLEMHRRDPRDASRVLAVEYVFESATGILLRRAMGEKERRYLLGPDSVVRFAIRNPVAEDNQAPARGKYHNIVCYRISSRAANVRGHRSLTLVGTVPLLKKSSWDTFLFWNLPTYTSEPGQGSQPAVAD